MVLLGIESSCDETAQAKMGSIFAGKFPCGKLIALVLRSGG